MALDRATTQYLNQLATLSTTPLRSMGPTGARAATASMKRFYGDGPPILSRRELTLGDGPGGSLLLVPTPEPRAVIVYYHGGGWVLGGVDEYEAFGRQLARQTGCAVALAAYRKAPEQPFPAAIDDAWEAIRWVSDHLQRLVGRNVPLVVAGDSAGGNLAAVVSRRARDAGGPAIAHQLLIYPITDCRFDSASYLAAENQLVFDRETLEWLWDQYVPDPDRRVDPDVSPARAELSGLPPATIVSAEYDVLRDEGEAYAGALKAAGVPITLHRAAGQMHGFLTMVNILPGSAEGIALVADKLDSALDAASSRAVDV
jgi:acetyl esterase